MGGGQKKFHVVFREGLQNVHVRLLGGRGGQNPEKKLLHSLWMPPYGKLVTYLAESALM